ncbi:MAG TPA: DUF3857 domain-containing protein [Terriglobia bacterium]|nr:DUF3857 domain-containing protein [Terriglobia bacterium]
MCKKFKVLTAALLFMLPAIRSDAQINPTPAPALPADNSKESAIYQRLRTTIRFENDGTATRETTGRMLVQSEAGVQAFGLLTFGYSSANEEIEIGYVRVHKPDGAMIETPADGVQDMAAEITRAAPMYSDYREKHVAVKGLGIGDILEYNMKTVVRSPLIPGQFWLDYVFTKDAIVLDEELEVNLPKDRFVNVKSTDFKPTITEEDGRRVYLWKTANIKRKSEDEEPAPAEPPPPPVQISTFRTWDEVGAWWGRLEQERVTPTPDIRAKAAELTKDAKTDADKVKTIYNYVSTRFRYISISFGIGRYQPHSADEVLKNAYGDCKDKHTLLASLLNASGLQAYPALINSGLKIDPEIPSPGHFDHVISVVPEGREWVWLDTTTEVAPFGFLMPGLRDKEALVIPAGKPASLYKTPADPPFKNSVRFEVDGALDEAGTLRAKIQRTDRGDIEVIFRLAFRQTPQSKWKDLVQRISYASGFAGEVTDVTPTSPEATDEPFRVSYQYVRKEYSDWANRRITPPTQICSFFQLDDKEVESKEVLKLSGPAEFDCKSRITLPKGYAPQLLPSADILRDFAEYHSTYSFKNGVFESERRIEVKLRELPAARREDYHSLAKAANDDGNLYTTIVSGVESEFIPSSIPEADEFYTQGNQAMNERKYREALSLYERATKLDPDHKYAWNGMGTAQVNLGNREAAFKLFRKQIEVYPKGATAYYSLALNLALNQRQDEAVQVWRELLKQDPDNKYAHSNLASMLMSEKKYAEATPELERAVADHPENHNLQFQLAQAYLKSGNISKALPAYDKAVEYDPTPNTWNNVAFDLAENNLELEKAQEYAEKAVMFEEGESAKVSLATLTVKDLARMNSLAADWDTLGWVYFRQGNLPKAEKYIEASWNLYQQAVVGDHLAQAYEKEGKKSTAAHMRNIVQSLQGDTAPMLRRPKGNIMAAQTGQRSLSEELSQLRRTKLGKIITGEGSAEFFVLYAPGGKMDDVKFLSGTDVFRTSERAVATATKAVGTTKFKVLFPDDKPTKLVRRAVMVCMGAQFGGCDFTLFTVDTVRSLK